MAEQRSDKQQEQGADGWSATRGGFLRRSAVLGGSIAGGSALAGAFAGSSHAARAASGFTAYPGGAGTDAVIRKLVAGRTLKVGFTPPILSEFFDEMEHAAWWRMAELESRYGVKWQWERAAPRANFNAVEEQVNIVQNWATKRFDACLVCTGANFATMQRVYKDANKHGTKIFQFNQPAELYPVDKINTVSNIGYDNRWQSGYLAGTYIAKQLKGKGNVIQIWGPPGSDWSRGRQIGFDRALKENPGLKVVGKQDGGYVRDKGFAAAQALLRRNKNVNAIYGENEEMALGGSQAIDAAGLKHWDGKAGILTIGADGLRSGFAAIRKGRLTATVDVGGIDQGLTFIDTIFHSLVLGYSVDKFINVPTKVVDKSNVDLSDAYTAWALKPPKKY
jgi:ribose transport system substrate-binding protein